MSYNKYSKEMNEAVVSRILSGEETLFDISRETGININTLYRWRAAAQRNDLSATTKYKNADKWSSQDKLLWFWKVQIYPEQVKKWKEAGTNANDNAKKSQIKESKELQEERREQRKNWKKN